jgi:hypothetical protein
MDPLFEVHMLNDAGKQKAKDIATAFDNCLLALTSPTFGSLCSPGRELAIVKTKLEEACFFAKKSMANVPENQA